MTLGIVGMASHASSPRGGHVTSGWPISISRSLGLRDWFRDGPVVPAGRLLECTGSTAGVPLLVSSSACERVILELGLRREHQVEEEWEPAWEETPTEESAGKIGRETGF